MANAARLAPEGVTALLARWSEGDEAAGHLLMPAVYAELRAIARGYMRRESGLTLQPTGLVHEAYLRLIGQRHVEWQNRAHFYGIAARCMRRILVDQARRRHAAKRGSANTMVSLDDITEPAHDEAVDVRALDDALDALKRFDAHKSQLVELRFFGGLSIDEAAHVLDVSPRTAARQWRLARAWLHARLAEGAGS